MTHPYDSIRLVDLRRRRSMKWRWFPEDVLPAWVAEMDFPLAEPIRAVLAEMIDRGDTGYAWPDGVAEAYAEWASRHIGHEPDPGRSAVVPDVMRGVQIAVSMLTPPGSGIAMLTPAYPPFFETVAYAGRRPVSIPMTWAAHDPAAGPVARAGVDGSARAGVDSSARVEVGRSGRMEKDRGAQVGVDTGAEPVADAGGGAERTRAARGRAGTVRRLEVDLERMDEVLAGPDVSAFLLCNPHNPTGRVFPAGELRAMAEIAVRHDVVVLADEVHAPLVYAPARHTPYASLGGALTERSVTFASASKGWNLAGLKSALAFAGGAETYAAFEDLPSEIAAGSGPLGNAAAVAAFTEGQPWLDDTLAYLDGNRRLLAELLGERLPGVEYVPPDATYLAWLDCRRLGLGDNPAEEFLAKGRVALNPGPSYGSAEGAGFVRLNFATSRPILAEIVDRMARALPSSRHT